MRLEPPSWWYGAGRVPFAAFALWPISAVYGGLAVRRFRTASPYRSVLPVICVGNFTLGGAGKTPVALKLAAMLREAGMRPGFLTRGFGGSERGPHLIDAATDRASRVGDEPLLLARAAPTVVSRDRVQGAKLIETLGLDVIIMDDGFQNPSLEKDFSLIVVDAGAGLGCRHVFPLGPLRAPLVFQLKKADAVLLLGADDRTGVAALLEGKDRRPAPLPIFRAGVVPAVTEDPRARPVLAFCGIGRPEKFFDTLRGAGVAVVKARAFPDHHAFTEADAQALLAEANTLNAALVTTEKDRARLHGMDGACAKLYRSSDALPIAVEFFDGGEVRLLNLVRRAAPSPAAYAATSLARGEG